MGRACVLLDTSVGMLTVQGWRQKGVILCGWGGGRGEEGRDQAGVRERSRGGLGIYQGGLCGFQKAKLPTFLIVS